MHSESQGKLTRSHTPFKMKSHTANLCCRSMRASSSWCWVRRSGGQVECEARAALRSLNRSRSDRALFAAFHNPVSSTTVFLPHGQITSHTTFCTAQVLTIGHVLLRSLGNCNTAGPLHLLSSAHHRRPSTSLSISAMQHIRHAHRRQSRNTILTRRCMPNIDRISRLRTSGRWQFLFRGRGRGTGRPEHLINVYVKLHGSIAGAGRREPHHRIQCEHDRTDATKTQRGQQRCGDQQHFSAGRDLFAIGQVPERRFDRRRSTCQVSHRCLIKAMYRAFAKVCSFSAPALEMVY